MMRKGARRTVLFFACFALSFFHSKVALSQSTTAVRDPKVSDIIVSPEFGFVTESHPADKPSAGLIVHIQEAHTNYEAQRHIAKILERLISEQDLKLILVEGGEGNVSLSYLRTFGSPANRAQIADKYLKAGIISAEEYVDITSDQPLALWGVEDRALYDQNVDAFLAADAMQDTVRPALASAREAVDLLKPRLLGPELAELEAAAADFKTRKRSLGDYAELLGRLAGTSGVSIQDYPNTSRFLELRRLERSIEQPAVQKEQGSLISRLSGVAPEARLEELVTQAENVKQGTLRPAAFYATLQQMAADSNIDLAAYPSLAAYLDYLDKSRELQPTVLSQELDAIAGAIRQAALDSPQSRELDAIAQEVDLIEKLVGLNLSPEEYARLDGVDIAGLAVRWDRFLNAQLAAQGLDTRSFAGLKQVEETLPTLRKFYLSAQQRDEQLVRRALAKLRESGEPIAALITGGFHAPEITKRLQAEGVATVVVTPKVTKPTDERLYRAVVKYKSGHGSFDDVMSAYDASAPATAPDEAAR